jgi:hypothetical protein
LQIVTAGHHVYNLVKSRAILFSSSTFNKSYQQPNFPTNPHSFNQTTTQSVKMKFTAAATILAATAAVAAPTAPKITDV